jgi:hypothetical protein
VKSCDLSINAQRPLDRSIAQRSRPSIGSPVRAAENGKPVSRQLRIDTGKFVALKLAQQGRPIQGLSTPGPGESVFDQPLPTRVERRPRVPAEPCIAKRLGRTPPTGDHAREHDISGYIAADRMIAYSPVGVLAVEFQTGRSTGDSAALSATMPVMTASAAARRRRRRRFARLARKAPIAARSPLMTSLRHLLRPGDKVVYMVVNVARMPAEARAVPALRCSCKVRVDSPR